MTEKCLVDVMTIKRVFKQIKDFIFLGEISILTAETLLTNFIDDSTLDIQSELEMMVLEFLAEISAA